MPVHDVGRQAMLLVSVDLCWTFARQLLEQDRIAQRRAGTGGSTVAQTWGLLCYYSRRLLQSTWVGSTQISLMQAVEELWTSCPKKRLGRGSCFS